MFMYAWVVFCDWFFCLIRIVRLNVFDVLNCIDLCATVSLNYFFYSLSQRVS